MRFSYFSVLCAVVLTLAGCRSTAPDPAAYNLAGANANFSTVTDSLAPDPAVEALIEPYRARLQDAISEVIGEAKVQLQKGGLESTLGNMSTDAMLYVVNKQVDTPVHMSLTNNGGLRVPIAKGPITVGKVFELMPFENMMTVLTLTSVEVDSLAQQLTRRTEPIAGLTFVIEEEPRRAVDIKVAGEPLAAGQSYRLVTSDYLADGGGRLPALWEAKQREDLHILLRDAFITYIRDHKDIHPTIEGRITLK